MVEVIMPKMGDGMEEGTLVEWLKNNGETVKSGEVIGTIQTDKATLELEAPASGTLAGILVGPGENVPVGKAIAAILKKGETLPEHWNTSSEPSDKTLDHLESQDAKTSHAEASHAQGTLSKNPDPSHENITINTDTKIKASPLAKKLADMHHIKLEEVIGTGPGGRIIEKDIKQMIENQESLNQIPSNLSLKRKEDRIIPLTRLRKVIAQRTQESKLSAPHFYVTVEVNVENIIRLRKIFENDESGKVSVNDFVVKACAMALQDMPEINASISEDNIIEHGNVNIGIAVAIPDGLVVPVVNNADFLTLREISISCKSLAKKARDGKLTPDEMQGSTFCISNMGMLNIDNFIAIINQPNTAIVAVSSITKKVIVDDQDEFKVAQVMNVSGSFDHRALDGAVGAKFMNIVRDYLEHPSKLLN